MAFTYGSSEWENAYQEMVKERLASEKPPFILGSPEWIATYEEKIGNDEIYRKEATTWEGTIVIRILPNSSVGIESDIFMLLDLWHGDCRSIRPVPEKIAEGADYMITAEVENWEAVMKGELETIKGMMQGKLKLDGKLPNIVRHVRAATRMVELTGTIETKYPTNMSEEDVEIFRALINKMRDDLEI